MSARGKRLIAAILLLQLALSTLYARRIALFNAPDENGHFAYAEYVAKSQTLPRAEGERFYEAVQPPLYYLLAAPVDWLFRGHPIDHRVSALRRQNVLFGVLDVFLIFLILLRLSDEETALAGAAFCALLPQFLFIGASVTNDRLADLMSSLILWLGLVGLDEKRGRWWPWAAGAALAAGFLTKLTVIGPAVAFALVGLWKKPRAYAAPIVAGALGAAATIGRNLVLYGDVSGARAMTYESAMGWRELGSWWLDLFKSFFGLFAWMASPLPSWCYCSLGVMSVVVLTGFAASGASKTWRQPRFALLWSALLLVFAQTFWFGFLRTRQPQGRFLFPALAALSFIMAAGWRFWWQKLPRGWRAAGWAGIFAGAAVLHIISLRAL